MSQLLDLESSFLLMRRRGVLQSWGPALRIDGLPGEIEINRY
jgi:hypothetical protein